MPAGAPRIVERQPDLGVEVLAVGDASRRCGREQRGEDVLRRRLAGRAGDADDRARRARAARRVASALQRGERVVGARARAPGAAPRAAVARARARRARPRRRPRAPAPRSAPPSTCSPGSPTNRSPGPTARESITARAGPPRAGRRRRSAPPAAAATRAAASRSRATSRARSASRATVTSSNGTLRPSANSWPCSWPLPAITTTSPGRGRRDRAARSPRGGPTIALDARAPAPAEDLVDDRLGVLASAGCRR